MIKEFKFIFKSNPILVGSRLTGEYVAVRDSNHNIIPIVAVDEDNGTITIDDDTVDTGDELYISRKDVSIIPHLDDGGSLPYIRQVLARLYNDSTEYKYIDAIEDNPNTDDTVQVGGFRLIVGEKHYRYINYSYYISDKPLKKLSTILNLCKYATAGNNIVVTNGVKYVYIIVSDRYYSTLAVIGDSKLLKPIGGVTRIPRTSVFFKCFRYDNINNRLSIAKEVL